MSWETKQLSDVADIVTGTTPKKADVDSWGDEVDFITPSDQSAAREARPERRLSSIGRDRLRKKVVPPRSTALTCIGATIGKVTMNIQEAVTNQQINTLVAKSGISDPDFVYYMIANWSPSLIAAASGSATPIVNKTTLGNFVFELPPLPEQRAIAEVLGALDDKIAANERVMSDLNDFLKAEFDARIADRPNTTLSEIAAVNANSIKKQNSGFISYIDIAAVADGEYAEPQRLSWAEAPGRARRRVTRGDTIWSTVRPNRRSHALVLEDDSDLIASTGLAVLSPHPDRIAGLYEASSRPEFVEYLENVAEGSAYPAVRAQLFLNAPVPDLLGEEWEYFEAIAFPMRDLQSTLALESRFLARTRDELLPLLMSGKVTVKDLPATATLAGGAGAPSSRPSVTQANV